MFEIKNYSNLITDQEIQTCFKMLNKRHKKLDATIVFFKSKLQLLFKYLTFQSDLIWLDFKTLSEVLFNNTTGVHHSIDTPFGSKSIIYIFPFIYKTKNEHINKLHIIETFFHEIRHAYQSQCRTQFYNEYRNHLRVNDIQYREQPLEKDSIKFTKKIMMKNKQKLDKIVCNDNWKFE